MMPKDRLKTRIFAKLQVPLPIPWFQGSAGKVGDLTRHASKTKLKRGGHSEAERKCQGLRLAGDPTREL